MDASLQSNLLTRRIQQAYHRTYRKDRNSMLGLLLAYTLLAFFGVYLFDRLTQFPAVIRVLLTLGILSGIWGWLYRKFSVNLTKSTSLEDMARDVERRAQRIRPGGFHSLLVSATEFGALGRPHGSSEFRASVIEQAQESGNDPSTLSLHSEEAARRTLKLLGAALTVYLVWALLSPASLMIFFARAAGFPTAYPTRTLIRSIEAPDSVGRFEDVTFQVQADGVLPVQGTLEISYEKGSTFDVLLQPLPDTPEIYQAVLERPPKAFEYQIFLGDTKSSRLRVRVLPPPVLREGQLTVMPPSYLDRSPTDRPLGSFQLWEGGSFDLRVVADPTVESCELELGEERIPMRKTSDGFAIEGVQPEGSSPFSVRLTGKGGIVNTRRPQYRITVMTDEPPRVLLDEPREGEFIAPPSLIRWKYSATDDLGLGDVRLRVQLIQPEVLGSEGEVLKAEQVVKTIERSLDNLAGVKEAQREGELTAEELGGRPGMLLQLQVRVSDHDPDRSPEEGWTAPVRLNVITSKELKELLAEELVGAHLMIQDIQDDMEAQQTSIRMRINPKTQPRGTP